MKKLVPIIIVLVVIVGAVVLFTTKKSSDKTSSSTTSSSSSSNSDNMNMSPPPAQPSSSPNNQQTNKVTIDNFAFSPANITVKKGTAVTWTNNDSATHNVKETDGKSGGPNSQDLPNGQSYTFTFNTVGTFNYHCSIHPDMTGTVTVTE
ncbi:MAG TPA: cupredoxin family copper-binding protein [Candidatus Saccharimonadales bacterium]|nr:cupredoxin family copper-binding protein [Candidatus Saccharimonadales bacterium]